MNPTTETAAQPQRSRIRLIVLQGGPESACETILEDYCPHPHAAVCTATAPPGKLLALEWLSRKGWQRYLVRHPRPVPVNPGRSPAATAKDQPCPSSLLTNHTPRRHPGSPPGAPSSGGPSG
jgi:hypothetical protein